MPKITTTITKSAVLAPWFIMIEPHVSRNFTQEEIDTVLTPFTQYIQSLPGYIQGSGVNININGNTLTSSREFDTIENLIDATRKLVGPNVTEPIVIAKNQLLKQKMDASNYTYTFADKIEP